MMMTSRKHITILGLGNILLKDEGFGVHFIRWFENNYRIPEDVNIVEGGTLGYRLLDTICSCDELIVIDVIRANDEPGSIYRFTKEAMEAELPPPVSAHEVSFRDVLCKAELIEQSPAVVFLCIVPREYGDMDLEMMPLMKEKFPSMEEFLLKELAFHDVYPLKVNHA
jgi:hydrogenase maturation protease